MYQYSDYPPGYAPRYPPSYPAVTTQPRRGLPDEWRGDRFDFNDRPLPSLPRGGAGYAGSYYTEPAPRRPSPRRDKRHAHKKPDHRSSKNVDKRHTFPRPSVAPSSVAPPVYDPSGLVKAWQRGWKTHLFDCTADGTVCCCVCCNPCYSCMLMKDFNESFFAPCCGPVAAFTAIRMKMRSNYSIEGSLLMDLCATLCCTGCVMCQVKREADIIKQESVGSPLFLKK